MKRNLIILFTAVLVLSGCQAAKIVDPLRPEKPEEDNRIKGCFRVLTVKFHDHFAPGSFRAELDGQDVTQLFGLPHNPGGYSNLAMQGPFTGGKQIPGKKIITVPQAPGQSIIDLPSGIFQHTLYTDGNCVAPYSCVSDEVEFIPAHVTGKVYSPNAPDFTARTAISAEAQLSIIPANPTQVEVVPTDNVSLYDPSAGVWRPGGHSIFVTIPSNDFQAKFGAYGSRGWYSLIFRAPGCQEGRLSGRIN